MLAPARGYSTPFIMLMIPTIVLVLSTTPVHPDVSPVFEVRPISEAQRTQMQDVTWRKGCPVGFKHLREVHVGYRNPAGDAAQGLLIVHRGVAHETKRIFQDLFAAGFVFEEIQPASVHAGNDDHLMATNTTSAFNCRRVTDGKGFSKHSYGRAIDINPLWNPYVKGQKVLPPKGAPYAKDRKNLKQPGLLHPESLPVQLFKKAGWTWGGDWKSLKDYQHVEKKAARKKRTN